jgi:hypothetical protein
MNKPIDQHQYFIRSSVRVSKTELASTQSAIMRDVRNKLEREVSKHIVEYETKKSSGDQDHTVEFYIDAYLIPADKFFALVDRMAEDRIRERSLRGTL